MRNIETLTQDTLKNFLTYNKLTGHFTRNETVTGRHIAGARLGYVMTNMFCRRLKVDGRLYNEHDLAVLYVTGNIPARNCVKHINGDRFDNRWDNLLVVDKSAEITAQELRSDYEYNKHTGDLIHVRLNRVLGTIWRDSSGKRYRVCTIRGKNYFVHRLIWVFVHGHFPPEQIDHIDGNGLNNAIDNLRSVTNLENSHNRRIVKTNTSGVAGVSFDKSKGKWRVHIQNNGERFWFGSYNDLDDAIAVRKEKEKLFDFHENHNTEREL